MPYTFKKGFVTENGASALNEATRLLEKVKLLLPGLSTENNPKYERFPAKITAVDGSGNYSWTEQFYDSSGAYSDLVNGRSGTPSNMPALERNGTTATAFPFYAVLQSRLLVDGQPVYEFDVSAGMHTIGITTEAVDGTPSYTASRTIRFDEADGFSLSQPSAGVARIDMLPAQRSNAGIVFMSEQEFGGLKRLRPGDDLSSGMEIQGDDDGLQSNIVLVADFDSEWGEITVTSGTTDSAIQIFANDLHSPYIRGLGSDSAAGTQPVFLKFISNFSSGIDAVGVYAEPLSGRSAAYAANGNLGQTGTSGGGDTVTGGIITTLGSGPTNIDGGTW